ncbi:hypothetical protein SISNIDRAFT_469113 [Sistotremastrum niveocremeum HHB9708]|uniref:Uncharacterized protein n=1 Tax=Sistotremastrum niveocremeum HHB9708 TaxID=1314777 RepID=A0A164QEM6_9AGAM|nr:hypothetical protein SISNIDRAFT_469113 [Sistotremastrum niveocremeum HHB9708]
MASSFTSEPAFSTVASSDFRTNLIQTSCKLSRTRYSLSPAMSHSPKEFRVKMHRRRRAPKRVNYYHIYIGLSVKGTDTLIFMWIISMAAGNVMTVAPKHFGFPIITAKKATLTHDVSEQTETIASTFQGESKDETELSAVLTPRQRTPNATRPGCSCKVGAPATLSLRQPRRSRNIAASRNAVAPPLLRSATLPQSRIDG